MKAISGFLCSLLLTCGLAFAGTDQEDAALIKGCDDPVITVLLQHGPDSDTVRMTVNDSWRGSYREGRSIVAKWDAEIPDMGSQWIVMGRVAEDGVFHAVLRYPLDRGHWVQQTLGILPPDENQ